MYDHARLGEFEEAVALMTAQSWRAVDDCVAALSLLVTALLKEPLTVQTEVHFPTVVACIIHM